MEAIVQDAYGEAEVPEAIRYLAQGHPRGRVVDTP